MKKNFTAADLIPLLIWLSPLAYLFIVYQQLGDHLPLHFDINGNPDRYGNKSELLTTILIMSAVSLGGSLLIRFAPRIDPKKRALNTQGVFIRISHAMILLLALLSCDIIYSSVKGHFTLRANLLLPFIGLFFAYLGNLLNSVKPNYFVGIRTPWTLENEEVWRKTHRLAAKIWLPGGIILAIIGLIVKEPLVHYLFITIILTMALIPVVYSYIFYKRLTN